MPQRIAVTVLLCVVACRASAQTTAPAADPAAVRPGGQANIAALSQAVRETLRTARVGESVRAEVNRLIAESAALPPGEARRRLAHALVLARGEEWDARQEFAWSLALRPERLIADSSHPAVVWLGQAYSAAYAPAGPLALKLALAPEAAGTQPARDLGTFEIYPRDLVDRPYAVPADLLGVADGAYRVVAELVEGGAAVCTLDRPVRLAAGIDARRGDVERRLAKVEGHEGTKASVRYPFDLARVFNIGRRNWNAFDLGLGTTGRPNEYDFAAGMKRSEELLAALEAGTDPLWRAKGDHKRHYWNAEAGEILPYRVYAPTTWDGKTPLPTVLILHGNTRDQDFYFERENGLIPRTVEKHGYLLVGVLGYHPNGGYNAGMLGRSPATAPTAAGAGRGRGGAPAGRGGGEVFANDMPRARVGELSEADTMRAFELARAEYPMDPKRTYLFGYSAGGAGAYYLGPKFAENWAAIATGGGTVSANNYPFDRLKQFATPVHIFYGDGDSAGVRNASQTLGKAMTDHGIEVDLVEYKGFNHDTTPGAAVPHLFEFFDAHVRK